MSEPIKSGFGESYIETNKGKIWSCKSLAEYIKDVKPSSKFKFIIREFKGMKYPEIETYKKKEKW